MAMAWLIFLVLNYHLILVTHNIFILYTCIIKLEYQILTCKFELLAIKLQYLLCIKVLHRVYNQQ